MMSTRSFTTFGQLADALEESAAAVPSVMRATVRHEATLLQALIVAHASGRPGPDVITGAYIGSWKVRVRSLAAGAVATVGTMKPQGMRLEYGFSGTDSLGRVYDQPPFPHVQPSVDVWEPGLVEAFGKALREVL